MTICGDVSDYGYVCGQNAGHEPYLHSHRDGVSGAYHYWGTVLAGPSADGKSPVFVPTKRRNRLRKKDITELRGRLIGILSTKDGGRSYLPVFTFDDILVAFDAAYAEVRKAKRKNMERA